MKSLYQEATCCFQKPNALALLLSWHCEATLSLSLSLFNHVPAVLAICFDSEGSINAIHWIEGPELFAFTFCLMSFVTNLQRNNTWISSARKYEQSAV
jgi:hypothetical protein